MAAATAGRSVDGDGLIEMSVIMCVRNGAGTISEQLAGLAGQDYRHPWELLVVDNGSTDGTTGVVEAWRTRLPNLTVVSADEQAGLAYARNVGARSAHGDVLAFCDADDIAASGWLSALAAGFRNADMVGGRLELDLLNGELPRRWRGLTEDDLRQPKLFDYLHYAVGANFAVRREAFEAVGGCDEMFTLCADDVDLSWRIQRWGGTLVFRDEAVMHYRLREDLRGLMRQVYRYGRAEALLRRKFYGDVVPVTLANRFATARHLLVRSWHLFAGPTDRGIWLTRTSHFGGQLSGSLRYRVLA